MAGIARQARLGGRMCNTGRGIATYAAFVLINLAVRLLPSVDIRSATSVTILVL